MTIIDKATTAKGQPLNRPQDKAFCLSAVFNLPARGRRLTLTFNVAVTLRDPASG